MSDIFERKVLAGKLFPFKNVSTVENSSTSEVKNDRYKMKNDVDGHGPIQQGECIPCLPCCTIS
jgi:hypothetical protein